MGDEVSRSSNINKFRPPYDESILIMHKVSSEKKSNTLVVDLDGTLIAGDSLWENLLLVVKSKPWMLFFLPLWLMQGRAALKHHLAIIADPKASDFLYRPSVLDLIQQKKEEGARIILATAADHIIAQNVANHLGLFDEVIASQHGVNLKSSEKLKKIKDLIQNAPFEYAGNDRADIVIWRESHHAYLVGEGHLYQKELDADQAYSIVDKSPVIDWRACIKALRIHQWAKNTLIFVPAILSHKLFVSDVLLLSCLAFLAFSFCASATYILNDLMDLAADRRHNTKSKRPFASGRLSILAGLIMSAFFMSVALVIALFLLSLNATLMLLGYVVLTLGYSFYFKRKLMVDVLLLGAFYVYRILFGGLVGGILVSPWLAAFSLFFFLSLAFVKRHSELLNSVDSLKANVKGRGYRREDTDMVRSFGASSGYMSILIMALYISSPDVTKNYAMPVLLWLICPGLLYWISRIWFLAERREINDDPVLFAVGDWHSRILALTIAAILSVATIGV